MTEKIYVRKLKTYSYELPYKWMVCSKPANDYEDEAYLDMFDTWEKAVKRAIDIHNGY